MSKRRKISTAEAVDTHLQILALAVFLFSLKYAASAAALVATGAAARVFDFMELATALAALAVVLPMAYLKFRRLPSSERRLYRDLEGYVGEMFKRAGLKSWTLTWASLVLLDIFVRENLTHLPAEFFVQTVASFTLGVFSIMFFYMVRVGSEGAGTEASLA